MLEKRYKIASRLSVMSYTSSLYKNVFSANFLNFFTIPLSELSLRLSQQNSLSSNAL